LPTEATRGCAPNGALPRPRWTWTSGPLGRQERKERRRDPGALAELIEQLAEKGAGELAGEILAFALDRHPAHAQLHLARLQP
jgi:hypothetical protein